MKSAPFRVEQQCLQSIDVCTFTARPLTPARMSVTPAASQTRGLRAVRSWQQTGPQQRQRGCVDLAFQPQLGLAHAEYDDARWTAGDSRRHCTRWTGLMRAGRKDGHVFGGKLFMPSKCCYH